MKKERERGGGGGGGGGGQLYTAERKEITCTGLLQDTSSTSGRNRENEGGRKKGEEEGTRIRKEREMWGEVVTKRDHMYRSSADTRSTPNYTPVVAALTTINTH